MDITSLLGGVSIGQDTSGYFKLSFNGLAVKTPDGKFWAYVQETQKDEDHLLDVSDLILDGTDSFIYRIPDKKVRRGDLIVTSDTPFQAYFVQDDGDSNDKISVLDPHNSTSTEYTLPANQFRIRFFVKLISLFPASGLGIEAQGTGGIDNKLLLLLLLGDKTGDSLTKLLLFQGLGDKSLGGNVFESNDLLPLLLLSDKGGGSDVMQMLLFMQALGEEEEEEHRPEPANQNDPKYKQVKDTNHLHKHTHGSTGYHYHSHTHSGGEVEHPHNPDHTMHEQNPQHEGVHHDHVRRKKPLLG